MSDWHTIYMAYPRHMAPRDAQRAIEKAISDLAKSMGRAMAYDTLLAATIAYEASPAGRNPDRSKIPYPATWYNRQSYLEDPEEWRIVNGNGTYTESLGNRKADSANTALARAQARVHAEGSEAGTNGGAGLDLFRSRGSDGRDTSRKLLPGTH